MVSTLLVLPPTACQSPTYLGNVIVYTNPGVHLPVWILYDRRRVVLALLVAGLVASFVAAAIAVHFSSEHWSYGEHCLLTSASWGMIIVWYVCNVRQAALRVHLSSGTLANHLTMMLTR